MTKRQRDIAVLGYLTGFLCLFVANTALAVNCSRIVSLSPSITDVLEELDLDRNLVAVSTYDKRVSEHNSLPMVGNLFDLNSEALIGVKPSVVFLLKEQRIPHKRISALGLSLEVFEHRTLEGIDSSIKRISELCGESAKGVSLLDKLHSKMDSLRERAKRLSDGKSSPKVLVVIGNGGDSHSVKRLFVSGKDGFFYPLLKTIGIEPLFHGNTAAASSLSLEAILSLRPTHILHIITAQDKLQSEEFYLKMWKWYPHLPALKKRQIFARNERFFWIPSIHYPKMLEAFIEMFLEDERTG